MYSRFQYDNNMKTTRYFTAIISFFFLCSCSDKGNENHLNKEASLPDVFLDKVSDLQVINSSINNKKQTTSLLYGNQKTIERIKSERHHFDLGEKLVWITWQQQSDPNWIGAIIPGKLISLEIVESVSEGEGLKYQKYEGNDMVLQKDTLGNAHQIELLLSQKRAILPKL